MADPLVALLPRYLDIVRSIIRSTMGDEHGSVYIFGSRARGNPRPASDIDLAVAIFQSGRRSISSMN